MVKETRKSVIKCDKGEEDKKWDILILSLLPGKLATVLLKRFLRLVLGNSKNGLLLSVKC